MGANRRFGLVIGCACGLIYAYMAWRGAAHPAWLIVAMFFAVVALTVPRTLLPLLKLWMKLGGLMHLVVSPVLLTLFYFGVVTPIGLLIRLFGKDLLHLKPNTETYWIHRNPPGPEPRTMTQVY